MRPNKLKNTIQQFITQTLAGKLTLEDQEKFLLQHENISAAEFKQLIDGIQKMSEIQLNLPDAIDICGTGGSMLPKINTSTIVAFIVASLGVNVAKHGNRASSGQFGSFDLLEALGVNNVTNAKDLERIYRNQNLVFLFAPAFYPIMKSFKEVRRKIGKPTFFNSMGPLLSPAHVKKQIIGTAFADKMGLIAQTSRLLGKKHVIVLHGEDGLDEVTLTGKTHIIELQNGSLKKYSISPKDFGVKPATLKEIQGGNAVINTKIALEILKGTCKTRHLDLVLINAALVLKFMGKTRNLREGYLMALEAVKTGRVFEQFEQYKTLSHSASILLEIVDNKKREVAERKKLTSLANLKKNLKPSDRNFGKALKNKGQFSIIAEVKRFSPSEGQLQNLPFKPAEIGKLYEKHGAKAISVLCDQKYFHGSLEDLKLVRQATKIPVLCKDFTIDEYQIYEARKYGTDAILLIASIVTTSQMQKFLKIAESLKMAAICEVHTLKELEKVLKTDAQIISINNRDLHTFTIDLETSRNLTTHIPKNKIIIAASGMNHRKDLEQLPSRVNAVLIGSSLMKSDNLEQKFQEFTNAKKFLKICGIRNLKDALFCEDIGVNFIGLNFVPTSKRKIAIKEAEKICREVKNIKKVGIFQNQPLDEVNHLAKKLQLDYVQLCGDENLEYIKQCIAPVMKTIAVKNAQAIQEAKNIYRHVEYLFFDGPKPGSGQTLNIKNITKFPHPYFIAGGVNENNMDQILHQTQAIGIDLATGVETNGQLDLVKIRSVAEKIQSLPSHL